MAGRKVSTAICYILIFLCAVVLTITSPLLTEITGEFGLDMTESGFIFTAKFLGFTLFILLGGWAADKYGKKRVLAIDLIAMAIFLLLFSLSGSYWFACCMIFFVGGACGVLESMSTALVADINFNNRSLYINITHVFFGIGALVGPALTGILVAGGVSWRAIYQFVFILYAIAAAALILNKMPGLPPQQKISCTAFKRLLKDKKFLLLVLSMFLYTGAEVGAWGWMSTFMKQNLGFDIVKSSFAVGIFWIAMIVGRLICTSLSLKYKAHVLLMILSYSAAVVTVLSGIVNFEAGVWICVVLLGLFYSNQWTFIVAYGSELYTESSGTVFALLVGGGGIGMSVVPFIMGIIGQYVGVSVSMISPAIFFLMIGIIFASINNVKMKVPEEGR